MNKKDMVLEILANTSYKNSDTCKTKINRNSLQRIKEVYACYLKDKENANFYYRVL